MFLPSSPLSPSQAAWLCRSGGSVAPAGRYLVAAPCGAATGRSSCRVSSPCRDVSAPHAFAATPLLFSTFKACLFKMVGAGLSAHCAGDRGSEHPRPQLCPVGSRPEGPGIPRSIFAPCSGAGILKENMHEEWRGGSSIPAVNCRASQKHHLIIPRFNPTLTLVLMPACGQHSTQNPMQSRRHLAALPAPSRTPRAMHA